MSGESFTFNTAGNYGHAVTLTASGAVVGQACTPVAREEEPEPEQGDGAPPVEPRAKVLERPAAPRRRTGGRTAHTK